MKRYQILSYSLLAALLSACGGSESDDDDTPAAATAKYSTTSTKGDYAEWSLVGDQLEVDWQVITDTGLVDHTLEIAATCGAAAATGVQSCTINTADCSAGVGTCPVPLPSGNIDVMVVPDVAIFAHDSSQLHVGFVKNDEACSDDVSGDYSYMHLGLGKRDIFGLYQSDANFLNVTHIDYGFETADMNASQSVRYNTGTPNENFSDDGCDDGVRMRSNGAISIRSMMTASGLFVLDLPAGEGGLLAFEASNAATLADFANKSFGGLSFPDNGPAEALSAEFAALAANKVDLVATVGANVQNLSIMNLNTADTLSNPAYPDFTTVPTGANANPLQSTYNSPNDIPGLFKFDGSTDQGRVIMAAVNLNSKVVAFGAVYNYRDTTDTNPSTGANFSEAGLYNTGSFLIFEK